LQLFLIAKVRFFVVYFSCLKAFLKFALIAIHVTKKEKRIAAGLRAMNFCTVFCVVLHGEDSQNERIS